MSQLISDSFHLVVIPGGTLSECVNSDSVELTWEDAAGAVAIVSSEIGVSCCEDNVIGAAGANVYRPDCTSGMTYDDATALCTDNGYRLCTEDELLYTGFLQDTDCTDLDGTYHWVSDECTDTSGLYHYVFYVFCVYIADLDSDQSVGM